MPLNETRLHNRPEIKRPDAPRNESAQPHRPVGQVRSDTALSTANTATDRIAAMQGYVENFNAAVGQQVDDAAFSIAATIASIPAQLANRTQFYLDKMGGEEAWSQFDRALSGVSRTTAEHLLFNSDVFELPASDLFEAEE